MRPCLAHRRSTTDPPHPAAAPRSSPLWPHVRQLRLRINMRVQRLRGADAAAQQHFSDQLLELGEGRFPAFQGTDDFVRVPPELCLDGDSLDDLIATVHGDLRAFDGDVRTLNQRAILAPRNVDVDEVNTKCMGMFPGEVLALRVQSAARCMRPQWVQCVQRTAWQQRAALQARVHACHAVAAWHARHVDEASTARARRSASTSAPTCCATPTRQPRGRSSF